MDGILFDTERAYQEAMHVAAKPRAVSLTDALVLGMVGLPWEENRRQLLDHFGPDFPADVFRADAHAELDRMLAGGAFLKPGVTQLLDALDGWGVPRAIATTSHRETALRYLEAHHLLERFDAIAAFGDYVAPKPAPDPYLLAASLVGADPHRCVAIEDSPQGVRAANAAGCRTIMVPDLIVPTPELTVLCARICADLHEVRALLTDVRAA